MLCCCPSHTYYIRVLSTQIYRYGVSLFFRYVNAILRHRASSFSSTQILRSTQKIRRQNLKTELRKIYWPILFLSTTHWAYAAHHDERASSKVLLEGLNFEIPWWIIWLLQRRLRVDWWAVRIIPDKLINFIEYTEIHLYAKTGDAH